PPDGRSTPRPQEQLGAAGVDADIVVAGAAEQRARLGELVAPFARLGLEANGVTWAQQRAWAKAFEETELVPTEDLVEGLRLVKEPGGVGRDPAPWPIADHTRGA